MWIYRKYEVLLFLVRKDYFASVCPRPVRQNKALICTSTSSAEKLRITCARHTHWYSSASILGFKALLPSFFTFLLRLEGIYCLSASATCTSMSHTHTSLPPPPTPPMNACESMHVNACEVKQRLKRTAPYRRRYQKHAQYHRKTLLANSTLSPVAPRTHKKCCKYHTDFARKCSKCSGRLYTPAQPTTRLTLNNVSPLDSLREAHVQNVVSSSELSLPLSGNIFTCPSSSTSLSSRHHRRFKDIAPF